MGYNFRVQGWEKHPEILELRRKTKLSKSSGSIKVVPQSLIDEVKSEIANQKEAVPIIRVLGKNNTIKISSTERFGSK